VQFLQDARRKRGQKSGRKVRGIYGTGKCAAFGIADSLTVETVENGKQNIVRLTRRALVPGLHKIPVKILVDDKPTEAENDTVIRIEKLRVQRLRRDSIRRFLEKVIGRGLKTHEVYFEGERLSYEEPPSVKEWKFRVPASLHQILGDCELLIKASSAPLEEEQRGISIIANDVVHEITLLNSEHSSTAWRLFGEIEIPLLDSEDPIPAYDNTRSLRLNEDNERVKRLHDWLDSTIRTVVKQLEEEDNRRIDKETEKALSKECAKIEDVLNKDFADVIKQLESKPKLGGVGPGTPVPDGSLGPSLGEGELRIKVKAEEGTPYEKASSGDYIVVEPRKGLGGEGPPNPSEPKEACDSTHPEAPKARDLPGGRGRSIPRGGFRVTYRRRGPDARRAGYYEQIQEIEINLDYPELACTGSIDSSLFRSLSYEIAIGEYASAVVQIMARCGYVDVEDSADSALAEWRRVVNRLGIAITPLIKASLQRTQTQNGGQQ